MSLGFAYGRAKDGDYIGAGMELLSGVASMVPGAGTVASAAIDASLVAKDHNVLSMNNPNNKENPPIATSASAPKATTPASAKTGSTQASQGVNTSERAAILSAIHNPVNLDATQSGSSDTSAPTKADTQTASKKASGISRCRHDYQLFQYK